MKLPRSLQARLGLSLGALLTLLWIAAASVTAIKLHHEVEEVFDSSLQETAQRILPLAVQDIIEREDDGVARRLGAIRENKEYFTYVVRDAQGRILLQSHAAKVAVFPPYDGWGFRQTKTHRLYNEAALQGSITITVAEPLEHRAEVTRQIQMGLGLPLLVIIPLALFAIILVVRLNLASLRRFQIKLAARNIQDMSAIPAADLPSEIAPVASTLNGLLDRLDSAFEAERSFAANAAHELRTPLAGAIAQAQRLRAETSDPAARKRAQDIETTLKRLTRLSERLMQLARAEGGRLRLDHTSDLRLVARLLTQELTQTDQPGRIALNLPDTPVNSDLDPDAFGILYRNLVENALRHGAADAPVTVTLSESGTLSVSNEGPVVPAEMLARLTARFERAGGQTEGSGLGLAIVAAITTRIGGALSLNSPRSGSSTGFEITVKLPTDGEVATSPSGSSTP